MSNARHTIGILCAGILAFGGVFAGYGLTSSVWDSTAVEQRTEADTPDASEEPGGSVDSGSATNSAAEPAAALTGRWVSERPTNDEAYVEIEPSGTWTSSDGCNRVAGTVEVDEAGKLVVTSGPMTLIGCDNDPAPLALATAVTAEIDGDTLTLTDAEAGVTTLVRE
ncbi:META domain-containing protein [Leucobacter luti]|uniref:Heat shock protein HslJ n=1 Tax=Leucobacter luti TaxID=340320 RepID=A0A4Q7TTX6_9MICO|nr:META domain-containing protein [Leucobacter luti]MBL3699716.1 META domain-containing protein [Leucobacter luti]RZT62962.1 heat shock protein HslJ [Leucobacter luti]